ncbi:HNH endonuclease signature motif containing protein [Streptomyces sp. NPDC047014]|uniref:HNH endonuclease n=1 Tax=Streptomyces sp. NPDC047014 TaxID=3155736 RepID=UPI0033D7EF2E
MKIPLLEPTRTYLACVGTSRDMARRELLVGAGAAVRKAGQALRRAAADGTLHGLEGDEFTVEGICTKDFVDWAYENGMQTVAGKRIRDALMAAPVDERCPLCWVGAVTQLDHVMPKSVFPALCVDPLNLVPACAYCNLIKGDTKPQSAEDALLHPYLDRISHTRWLHARTVWTPIGVRLEFFVAPPDSWDPTLVSRVTRQFTLLNLGTRYAQHANRTITDVNQMVTRLRVRGGANVVRNYLLGESETRFAADANSIEGVTYVTLSADDAYCHGPSATHTA